MDQTDMSIPSRHHFDQSAQQLITENASRILRLSSRQRRAILVKRHFQQRRLALLAPLLQYLHIVQIGGKSSSHAFLAAYLKIILHWLQQSFQFGRLSRSSTIIPLQFASPSTSSSFGHLLSILSLSPTDTRRSPATHTCMSDADTDCTPTSHPSPRDSPSASSRRTGDCYSRTDTAGT